ncbi:Zinc finger, RING/FYVE/PHD-type [Artemisia annua]|uniref:Zinc finger, RING/FYVE/PHD-type n=1 Tax=Artemisia annua TaxID=35608 RepID=A0A2U1LNB9_ARTAN|nr:Zinc finger, RING/FYVE/PHD-type [Artemisia annua]
MTDNDGNKTLTEIYIILLVIACGALMIALYHCISMLWWDLHHHRHRRRGSTEIQMQGHDASIDNSVAGLIPAHKHKKVMGSDDDEPMCAVCLSEFEEGEELRTLPDCMHSFHVPCIDMWLYAHRSCPICRMEAGSVGTPLVEIIYIVDPEPQHEEDITRPQNLDVPQDLVTESMAV